MKKAKVIETLDTLPEKFSTEELIDKIIFIKKVEKGLEDIDAGNTITLSRAKERMAEKWSK
jgi:uncharacterized protein YktA (UPF0223 family)